MIPAFRLERPRTLEEAIDLRVDLGDGAHYYAGGTELLLVLREGFLSATALVDLKRVPELGGVLRQSDGALQIGATTTHAEIERSLLIQEQFPEFAALESNVANLRVRNSGTLGGNLSFAEPHGDPAAFLIAAGASVELRGPNGARWVALEDWIRDAFDVDLRPGEVLVGVRLPPRSPTATFAYRRFRALERPTVGVAIRLEWDSQAEAIVDARVVIGCAGPKPQRMLEAEEMLRSTTRSSLAARVGLAAASAADAVDTNSDAYGPEEYKRHMVAVLLQRAVASAAMDTSHHSWIGTRPDADAVGRRDNDANGGGVHG